MKLISNINEEIVKYNQELHKIDAANNNLISFPIFES